MATEGPDRPPASTSRETNEQKFRRDRASRDKANQAKASQDKTNQENADSAKATQDKANQEGADGAKTNRDDANQDKQDKDKVGLDKWPQEYTKDIDDNVDYRSGAVEPPRVSLGFNDWIAGVESRLGALEGEVGRTFISEGERPEVRPPKEPEEEGP